MFHDLSLRTTLLVLSKFLTVSAMIRFDICYRKTSNTFQLIFNWFYWLITLHQWPWEIKPNISMHFIQNNLKLAWVEHNLHARSGVSVTRTYLHYKKRCLKKSMFYWPCSHGHVLSAERVRRWAILWRGPSASPLLSLPVGLEQRTLSTSIWLQNLSIVYIQMKKYIPSHFPSQPYKLPDHFCWQVRSVGSLHWSEVHRWCCVI